MAASVPHKRHICRYSNGRLIDSLSFHTLCGGGGRDTMDAYDQVPPSGTFISGERQTLSSSSLHRTVLPVYPPLNINYGRFFFAKCLLSALFRIDRFLLL